MKRRVTLVALVVLVALAIGGTTAFAGAGAGAGEAASAPAPRVGEVDGLAPAKADGDHCVTGPTVGTICFRSQAQVIRYVSGGKVQLDEGASALSLGEATLASMGVSTIMYEHPNLQGASLSTWTDGCSGAGNMPSGWNDRVSSAWVANTCYLYLYEHYNLAGASLRIPYAGYAYVGDAWNDRASSWRVATG